MEENKLILNDLLKLPKNYVVDRRLNNQKMLTKYNDTTITLMKSINPGNIAFYEKKT